MCSVGLIILITSLTSITATQPDPEEVKLIRRPASSQHTTSLYLFRLARSWRPHRGSRYQSHSAPLT